MIQIKARPRCHGDMIVEELLGESELVCLSAATARLPRRSAGSPPSAANRRQKIEDGR